MNLAAAADRNKVGLVINSKTLVVTAIDAFEGNPHDSKTIQALLEQMQDLQGYLPREIVYDRGGKGQSQIMGVKISTPSKPLKRDSTYQKQKKRRKFRRRAESARTCYFPFINRSSDGTKLPSWRELAQNECHVSRNWLELQKNDAKAQRKTFAVIFVLVLSKKQ